MSDDSAPVMKQIKRGRPKGSRNVPKRWEPLAGVGAKRSLDPTDMVNDQMALLHFAQCSLRKMLAEEGITDASSRTLLSTSTAIAKAVQALKGCADLEDEMSKRLSPEKLIEAAILKIESQDESLLVYTIRRLNEALRRVRSLPDAPVDGMTSAAVDAIAALTVELP